MSSNGARYIDWRDANNTAIVWVIDSLSTVSSQGSQLFTAAPAGVNIDVVGRLEPGGFITDLASLRFDSLESTFRMRMSADADRMLDVDCGPAWEYTPDEGTRHQLSNLHLEPSAG